MGSKTGASRCLIDAAEREWKMSLPDPVPLSLLDGCSCLQLRNASLGFAVGGAAGAASVGEKGEDSVVAKPSAVTAPLSAPKAAPVSTVASLGSKKVRVVAAGSTAAVVAPSVECTTVLENVTLDAHQKSKIAILGKNGCGKR